MTSEKLNSESKSAKPKPAWMQKLGVALILLSGVFFFTMVSVPWMSIDSSTKVYVGGTLFVCVQVAWWVGAALVGPAAFAAMKTWFGKTFARKS